MINRRISVYLILFFLSAGRAFGQSSSNSDVTLSEVRQFAEAYCLDCHNQDDAQAGLRMDQLLQHSISSHTKSWESIVRKLVVRQMPPATEARPEQAEYEQVIAGLVSELDQHAQTEPNPGRTPSFRRMNRTEYRNVVRDLLALDVDVRELLPKDEASHGFDNITVTRLSPVLLDRYVSAAQKISRLAVGERVEPAAEKTVRIRPDVTQDTHLAGAPMGTRGGTVIRHHFPQDGEYEIQAWLMRDRNEEVESLRGTYQLEVALDRERVELFTIAKPPPRQSDKVVDANLKTRVQVSAGPHDVGVVFLKNPSSLLETVRQPLHVHFNYYRHPRIETAVYQVTIRGPFEGVTGQASPSRQRIFVRSPKDPSEYEACAEQIIRNLMRRAYRREPTDTDLQSPMKLFREGLQNANFDVGIERALSGILVSPHFLFRLERDPEGLAPGSVYRLPSLELATRLSFFLWSSIPDDELREAAIDGRLAQPEVLESQVRRMLADERSASLIRNFAAQWLYLRNLESAIPDMRLYPDFDDNLRQAFRQETELFFESVVREDRSVLDLIKSDYTFLNERLAQHYGIPHVYGSRFRRVQLDPDSRRGGLLRQGSILTVTSYATRTSPVIRGNWVLENLMGAPAPPPPPNVPALDDNTVSASRSIRERLKQHRADEACASCHNLIDPLGFALENFDAVGRWRNTEAGEPIPVAGQLADGTPFVGVSGLEKALLQRPDWFVQTLTEKLMTFALGRGLEHHDAPAVRRIVRDAARNDYRFSEVVLGIVNSVPFQMRKSQ